MIYKRRLRLHVAVVVVDVLKVWKSRVDMVNISETQLDDDRNRRFSFDIFFLVASKLPLEPHDDPHVQDNRKFSTKLLSKQ